MFRGQFNRQGFDRGASMDTHKVFSVNDLFSLSESDLQFRKLNRIITDTLLRMEDFRAPMTWKQHINETLQLSEDLSLQRDWVRSINEGLNLHDNPSIRRDWIRQINEELRLSDLPDHLRERYVSLIEAIEFTESLDPVRGRHQSVIDSIQWTEEIVSLRKALWTLLATADARQTVPCSLGGGKNVELTIRKGNDKTFEANIRDEALRNLNIDNATVYFMVKNSVKDADANAVITKSTAVVGEVEITNPVGGLCEVNLVPDDTANLPVKRYVYDVKIVLDTGETYTVALGDFVVSHVVKRA